MNICGTAKIDHKTKHLIQRITSKDIAIIHHEDLDYSCGYLLAQKRVKAVINTANFISGKYPGQGPGILIDAGIPIYENKDKNIFRFIRENDYIEIDENILNTNGGRFYLSPFTKQTYSHTYESAKKNVQNEFEPFIHNTLEFLKKEKDMVFHKVAFPHFYTEVKGRTALIVIRGPHYVDDLIGLYPIIKEQNPLLIGVDGGADAFFIIDQNPDIIFGDMDSVSNEALMKAKDIVVHGYIDGCIPGEDRVKQLGLPYQIYPCFGTSEDALLLMLYRMDISQMIVIGSHTSMIDFLEKNRKGMSSTILVRMLVGSKLIDAKGYHKLLQ